MPLPRLFRRWSMFLRARLKPRRTFRFARLRFESLESRWVPATITWNNAAGGNWSTASNWDLNRVPTNGDDVVIPDLGVAGPESHSDI